MAQLNITLNQEEIQALLLDDRGEAFKQILQTSLNKILQVESAEQLKALVQMIQSTDCDCCILSHCEPLSKADLLAYLWSIEV